MFSLFSKIWHRIIPSRSWTLTGNFSVAQPGSRGFSWRHISGWVFPAAILLIPFRRIAPLLGHTMIITPAHELPNMTLPLRISLAVCTAARFTPWESKCLAQAMSARIMLKRLCYPTTLYLGLAKKKSNELSAHAWLRCGSRILTGGAGHGQFTVVGAFGDMT